MRTATRYLKPLDTIECRDAVLTDDGQEPEWPAADVVIGNPPFLGTSLMRGVLGDNYAENLRQAYVLSVPASADLVCYWFDKAERLVASGELARAGLVATNSIRGRNNRAVLDRIVERDNIFDAWSDQPWVVEGAAVRVSLICFAAKDAGLAAVLNGEATSRISSDLASAGPDMTKAVRLKRNLGIAHRGDEKNGSFDISGDLARVWLRLPANPNGRPNSDVLKPWINATDVTKRPAGKWIIDFGPTMSEENAALYEAPFGYVEKHVKPIRQRNRRKSRRDTWHRHGEPGLNMRRALRGLSRYIATPRVAKHRTFVWCDARTCPDTRVVVIARDDDTTFGILHSRFHEAWSLKLCSWHGVGNDPTYNPTTVFQTFPFPEGLTPEIPAADYADDPRAIAIAQAARRLVELRDRWLNPPEWVEWVDEPVAGYPKRPVPTKAAPVRELRRRTLTNLYNERPRWLVDAHGALDGAVTAAYSWPREISEDDSLQELLELNLARSA